MTRRGRRGESGFALLFVFVMAAFVAIALYLEMPRVAFETQRNKEQLLVDRGMEYRRGIQLFYRKFKRYPTRMEELESSNNIRFLRKRYVDPMTGKEEWRLVHIGPGGMLTDSLVPQMTAAGAPGSASAPPAGSTPNAQGAGATGPGGAPANASAASNTGFNAPGSNSMWNPPAQDPASGGGLNMATARRPSDHVPGGLPGSGVVPPAGQGDANRPPDPTVYQPGQPGQPVQPGPPASENPVNPVNPVDPNQPGVVPPGVVPPGQTGQPVQPGVPGQPPFPPGQSPLTQGRPGQPLPGQQVTPGQPGAPGQAFDPNKQPGVVLPSTIPPANGFGGNTQAGQPGQAGPVGGTPPVPNIISNILSSPRQQTTAGLNGASGAPIGAGIAGVATTYKGEGIKVINDRKKYQEWEFVYDFKTDRSGVPAVPQQGAGAAPGNPINAAPAAPAAPAK
jgi:hypothetical protein